METAHAAPHSSLGEAETDKEKALAFLLKAWGCRSPTPSLLRASDPGLGSKQLTEKAAFCWVSQAKGFLPSPASGRD